MVHLATFYLALAAVTRLGVIANSTTLDMGVVFSANPKLKTLAKLFSIDPDLFDASQDPVDTTFLAPSDEAFREFLRVTRGASDFLENKATRFRVFKDLMNYHTLRGSYTREELHEEDMKILRTRLENTTYVRISNMNQVARIIQENGTDYIYGGRNERISIIDTDMELWNGYAHVVDGFLKLPAPLYATVDELSLDEWVNACDDAGVQKEFADMDDVTMFIPRSADFPSNYSISPADILRYHVVKGKTLYSNNLMQPVTKVDSLQGGRLIITRKGDSLFVNDAAVVTEDVIFSAGVIHIIDHALDPLGTNFTSTERENPCTCTDGKCVTAKGKPCSLEPAFAVALTTGADPRTVSAGSMDDSRNSVIRVGILTALAAVFIYTVL